MIFSCYTNAFRSFEKTFQLNKMLVTKTRRYNAKSNWFYSTNERTLNSTRTITSAKDRNVIAATAAIQSGKKPDIDSIDEGFGSNLFTSDDNRCFEIEDNNKYDKVKIPGVLNPCDKDLSDLAPWTTGSFNFAAYANDSSTIQELAKLGVDLHKVEKRTQAMELLLKFHFNEMKPYIRFLYDCGIKSNNLGLFITKNPYIFSQTIEDMTIRIRYLRAHKFNPAMIERIVEKNPFWLMYSTKRIDCRLGYFQQEYDLSGFNIRYLATKQPRLITYSFQKLQEIHFAMKEEMGFSPEEMKILLLDKPRIFMKNRKQLVELFDYVHNTMKLPHEIIVKQAMMLTCRIERIRSRHEYLRALGKVQYDPTQPMYVSPTALIAGTDLDFCRNVAKTTIETYDLFLKTL
ncbi:transcription termination factor 3, mitochondrial [Venturia canescens]|uniref:transcription termination factor 3, mitochondrial n=1 Tax=Venturia canescens TaxID=32260 RepID=UPI001C9CAC66|nr:transcription termination factor 3, mitochondrial [Venturia canescens]